MDDQNVITGNVLPTDSGKPETLPVRQAGKNQKPKTKRLLSSGFWFLALLILFGLIARSHSFSSAASPPSQNIQPILGACSGSSLLFSNDMTQFGQSVVTETDGSPRFAGKLDGWRTEYDATVDAIVEAHVSPRSIQCSDVAREPPSPPLQDLASRLPPWQGSRIGSLSEEDMAAVLLEYQRIYLCALKEQTYFYRSRDDLTALKDLGWIDSVTFGSQWLAQTAESAWVKRELTEAPLVLGRTLRVVEGMDRLRGLDHSLECLSRTSLDIRNALGLAAEVSACLPRIWDSRGSLRTLSE